MSRIYKIEQDFARYEQDLQDMSRIYKIITISKIIDSDTSNPSWPAKIAPAHQSPNPENLVNLENPAPVCDEYLCVGLL